MIALLDDRLHLLLDELARGIARQELVARKQTVEANEIHTFELKGHAQAYLEMPLLCQVAKSVVSALVVS